MMTLLLVILNSIILNKISNLNIIDKKVIKSKNILFPIETVSSSSLFESYINVTCF